MTRPRIRQREQRRFFGRRPGIVPGRRFALVLALGVLLPAVAASSAFASADDQFVVARVFSPSGSSQASVTIGQLINDPGNCPEYTGPLPEQHGRAGQPSTPGFNNVWAVSTILGCLRPAPTGVTSVTVPNSNGFSQLSPAEMGLNGGQSDFANPLEFPVIGNKGTIGSESVQYDRPWKGGNDNNFIDEASESSETPLPIDIFEGPQLSNLKATASPNTVQAGGSVTFSVTFTPDSGNAQYTWKFDGGAADSSAAAPQITFTSPGTYDVQVEVIDPDSGSTGVTGTQVIVTSTSSTPPPNNNGQGTTGPTNSDGNAPGGAPSQQQNNKPASPHGHKGGTGNNGGTNGKHHGSSKPSGQKTTPTKTTTTPKQTPSGGGGSGTGGSGTGSAGSSGGPASTGATASNPQQHQHNSSPLKSTPPATQPNEHLVTGQLVSDVKPLPVDQSPLVSVVPAALAAARAAHPPTSKSILAPLTAGFAIVALLGLGAARELRGRRDWRSLRFGS